MESAGRRSSGRARPASSGRPGGLWPALLLAAVLQACAEGRPTGPGHDGAITDLLVITVDTTRADRFSYTGLSPVETPNIDALAAEGTAFLQAISVAPITLVAHASLFTGQLPVSHGVHNNGTYRLGSESVTLAEVLREAGYSTAAFVGAAVLDGRYGLDQGFEHYDDAVYAERRYPERRAEEVVEAALGWLDGRQAEKTFVWVHLFDPHDPYDPPEPERSRYPDAPYDGEIAYVDRAVGRLLEGYRSLGKYRASLIVLTSDHGESLGAHGEMTHGIFLYDDTVRVPLVIRGPGLEAGRRVAEQVQLIDLAPTLCSLLGVAPPSGSDGLDLTAVLRGSAPAAPVPAYLESLLPLEAYAWAALRGVRTGDWKLVRGAAAELYDLAADPQEMRDLAPVEIERVGQLGGLLTSLRAAAPPRPIAERLELDETTRRQLAALGYVSGDGPAREERHRAAAARPDPRLQVPLLRSRSTAVELFARGFHPQGIERLEAILRQDPTNPMVRRLLAHFHLATGGLAESRRLLLELVEMRPSDSRAWRLLGVVAERRGDSSAAIAAHGTALRAEPQAADLRARRWELMLEAGRQAEVGAEATAALAANAADGGAMAFVAIARWTDQDDRSLEAELRRGLQAEPEETELLIALADLLWRRGQRAEARSLLVKAQALEAASVRLRIRLAGALLELGEPSEVHDLLRSSAAIHLFEPRAWLLLGESCRRLGDRLCAIAALHRFAALEPGPLGRRLEKVLPVEAPGERAASVERLSLAGRFAEALALSRRLGQAVAGEAMLRRQTGWPTLGEVLAGGEAALGRGDLSGLRQALRLAAELLTGGRRGRGWADDGDPQPPAERRRAAEALGRIGSAAWEGGHRWEAVQAYTLGTILMPGDPRLFYNAGLAWERVGDLEEARLAFVQVRRLDPLFPGVEAHLRSIST